MHTTFQQIIFIIYIFQTSATKHDCMMKTVAGDRKIYLPKIIFRLMSWAPRIDTHRVFVLLLTHTNTRHITRTKFNYDIFQTHKVSDINYRQLFQWRKNERISLCRAIETPFTRKQHRIQHSLFTLSRPLGVKVDNVRISIFRAHNSVNKLLRLNFFMRWLATFCYAERCLLLFGGSLLTVYWIACVIVGSSWGPDCTQHTHTHFPKMFTNWQTQKNHFNE